MSRAPRARKPVAKYAVAREPRALFDVNVLIALLDTDHLHHARATQWLAGHIEAGWASCAITQNGCVCITSQPGYPNPLPAARVAERLRAATATPHHLYIGDAPSLLDEKAFDSEQLLGHRQVADARRGCAPPAPARDFRCPHAAAGRARCNAAAPRRSLARLLSVPPATAARSSRAGRARPPPHLHRPCDETRSPRSRCRARARRRCRPFSDRRPCSS